MKLIGLHIYPVKSCGGISLVQSDADSSGLLWDRRWMVVDATGRFVSQREFPWLSRVATSLTNSSLELSYEGLECRVPLQEGTGKEVTVSVWIRSPSALDQGEEAAQFFTKILGAPHRLVRCRENEQSFADSRPLLLVGTASLRALNAELGEAVLMDRFRPNLIVDTNIAYEEDAWKRLTIGQGSITIDGLCSRCIVINVDQATGQRKGAEPLRTLAQSRRQGNKIMFGVHGTPNTNTCFKVGDPVY